MGSLILKDVTLFDGLSTSLMKTDLSISEGKITAIGSLAGDSGDTFIQADGLIASPGFIDVHAHSDLLYPECRLAPSKVMQGVTTDVVGLCGLSRFPCESHTEDLFRYLGDFIPAGLAWTLREQDLDQLKASFFQKPSATNMAYFVGHGTLRLNGMGMANRASNQAELEKMKNLLRQAMQMGARGLSSGLAYAPGSFADTNELVELCRELVPFGGIYNSHIRDEGPHAWQALNEAAEIARSSGCRLHISHHKIMGKENAGFAVRSLELFKRWRNEGIDVTFDVYPYNYGSTSLSAFLPKWIYDYPPESLRTLAPRMIDWLSAESSLASFCGWDYIVVGGKTLMQRARERCISPQEALVEAFLEQTGRMCLYRCVSQGDIDVLLKSAECMVGSDGYPREYKGLTADGCPHPRSYGTFPKFIREFVFERKLVALPEALRRVTSLPAHVFCIPDRGVLSPGKIADVVLFDPNRLHERGSYDHPNVPPEGIVWVFVNGTPIVENGLYHQERCEGQIL